MEKWLSNRRNNSTKQRINEPIVGVLAFHGDFQEHLDLLRSMNIPAQEVRSLEDLKNVTHLIIPGGESTVMSKFFVQTGVGQEVQKRARAGDLAVYGTCAGAILIAKKITGKNVPKSLGLMDITVERNAYGTQAQSFSADLEISGVDRKIHVSFIRAPIITKYGKDVEVLASYDDHPVLLRQGKLLAGAFHPEVRGEKGIHRLFLDF